MFKSENQIIWNKNSKNYIKKFNTNEILGSFRSKT